MENFIFCAVVTSDSNDNAENEIIELKEIFQMIEIR